LVIGIDRDYESLERTRETLAPHLDSVRLFHDNFKNLPLILNNLGLGPVDGILVDLGISSYQLLSQDRGFSFQGEGMLDMRMDRTQRLTAADLVNELPEEKLADIIYRYGEERASRRIASAIVDVRRLAPITRCSHLAEIVKSAVRGRSGRNIHPATKTFQALRIAVNKELEGLEEFLVEGLTYLRPGGRIVALSFHSLEDRIVKRSFRMMAGLCVCNRAPELCTCPRQDRAHLVTWRSRTPSTAEVALNPRARSARLRAIERI
jgi:16S rRNA (cytosine1402-N4)-methyltransferase